MATFNIQENSSTVNWTGKKVLGLHTGNISVAGGYVEMSEGIITGGEVQVDMTSIVITDIPDKNTHDEFLAHLHHDDFFSVDKFKTATLTIAGATRHETGKQKVSGLLTVKDITHPISFVASVEVFTDYLHSMGEIVIDRTQYGIRYGSGKFIQNLGDKLIYDDFVLQFKLIAEKVN
jgi:polyisoprenoid-binding protein YceI